MDVVFRILYLLDYLPKKKKKKRAKNIDSRCSVCEPDVRALVFPLCGFIASDTAVDFSCPKCFIWFL